MTSNTPAGAAAAVLLLLLALAACAPTHDEAPMSGYAEADLVYLASGSAGTLQSLAVRRGDRVSAGQPLYALDADAETLAREAALAHSEHARSQEDNLRKGRRPLELQALDQQLAQARAALASSTSTLQRSRELVAQGFLSALRLDELAAATQRDAARVKEVEAQRLLAAQAARSDEIAAASALARGAGAELALAQWRESQRRHAAPTDAVVFDVMYRIGEWVPAGAPVVSLLPPEALKLRFFVPEPQLVRAAVGTAVAIACDVCPAGIEARITWVSPRAEYTPPLIYGAGTRAKLVFMVEARPGPGTPLKPGQPVDVYWRLPG